MEGAVNGYGGKIKADDGPEQAMTRTYMEQTGSVDRGFAPEWRYLGVIRGVDYAIFVYSMFDEDIEEHFKDRLHELYSIDDLDDINCVYDVPEMIRMSLSQHSFADNQEFVWIRRTQEAADWEEDPQT
jgi:hypothetical protein